MGLFKQHFHWKALATWPIGAIGILLALAAALRAGENYGAASVVVVLAGLAMLVRVIHAAAVSEHSRSNRVAFTVICALVVVSVDAFLIWNTMSQAQRPQVVSARPLEEKPQATTPEPDSEKPAPPGSAQPLSQGNGAVARGIPQANEEEKRIAPAPTPAPALPSAPPVSVLAPITTEGSCDLVPPDEEPKVRLRTGDLVVANGRGLYRVDQDWKETKIVESDYLGDVRGVAVDASGQILISVRPCGKGAVVRVDPLTGKQLVVATGFKVPMGIAIERDHGTILVGDEWGRPNWGYLWRIDLDARTMERLHIFQPSAVATSIAIDPKGEVFLAARTIYRWRDGSPRSVGFDDLDNIHAMTITPQGEMYIAEYNGGPVMHMRVGTPKPVETFQGFAATWSAASSRDGKTVFFGSNGGTGGRVYRLLTGDPKARPEEVWKGHPGGLGTFVTVVGTVSP